MRGCGGVVSARPDWRENPAVSGVSSYARSTNLPISLSMNTVLGMVIVRRRSGPADRKGTSGYPPLNDVPPTKTLRNSSSIPRVRIHASAREPRSTATVDERVG